MAAYPPLSPGAKPQMQQLGYQGTDSSAVTLLEGRMRAEAFVTFPSIELPCCALNLVNGFALKGKPMIIHSGQNRGAAKASEE